MSARFRWLLLLLLLVPALWFPGALPGPRVVSADDHLSVHHVFQSAAGGRVRHPQLSDPALQFAGLRGRVVDALSRGQAPLWNPDLYGGAPLLGDGQSMVGSPVTWARLWLPEDTAQDFGVWFVLVSTGLGAALLFAAWLPGAPWAAVVVGAAAMTGPFPSVWLLHPHAATFCWLPWMLLAVERRSGLGAAAAVAGLIGGGHPGTIAHCMGIGAVYWAVRDRSLRVALGVVAGGLLAAPLWAPLAEQAARSTTLAARGSLTLEPAWLLDLVWPGYWGHPAREDWGGAGAWADAQLSPGLMVLALAGLGARRGWPLWAGWAVLIVLAWTGLPGPFDHARLAGIGAVLLAFAAGFGVVLWPVRWRPVLLGLVVITNLYARRSDQGTLPASQHSPAPAAWTEQLRAGMGCDGGACGRVLGIGWAVQPNTGALAGLRDLRGYDLPVSRDTQRLMAALNPRPRGPWYPVDDVPAEPLLDLAAVRAVVVDAGQPAPAAARGWSEIPLGDAPVRAWRRPGAIPVAWWTGAAVQSADPVAALQRSARDPSAREMPWVEGLTGDLRGAPALVPVALTEDGGSVRRLASPGGAGLVVLSEAWAPGWRASVDGAPSTVLRVGGVWLGVQVPDGGRDVVLRYRPDGWILGLRLALAGLLMLLGLVVWRLRGLRTGAGASIGR